MHVAAEQHRSTYPGRLLRERWGAAYERAPHDTFEGALALAAQPALRLDLRRRGAADAALGAWLRSP